MNPKGQAFSVFQLLISAIVAFAILYILLTIIGGITTPGTDPGSTAKTMISDRLNNPGSMDVSDVTVRFSEGSNLTPSAITKDTGIPSDSVCIAKDEHTNTDGFEFPGAEGKALYYNGTSAIDAKIAVICYRADLLQTILEDLGVDEVILDGSGDSENYSCGLNCDSESRADCCVVMLKFK